MNAWQKRRISPSDLPLGSKSHPPLPPPFIHDYWRKVAGEGMHVRESVICKGTFSAKIDACCTYHCQTGQSILKDLLKAKEFKNTFIDSGVEAQTSLVGPKNTA